VTVRGRSWTGIGESMGRFVIQLHPFGLKGIEIELAGEDETLPAETIIRSVLKGSNIGHLYNGRDTIGGKAITLLRIDSEVSDEVLKEIPRLPNILNATRVYMA